MSQSTKKQQPAEVKMIALVIAESFCSKDFRPSLHPITQDVPLALLPICNTALIDYVLENLVQNGVTQTFVLLSKSSFHQVREHMQTVRSSRGKAWLDCREMRVVPVESTRTLANLNDAIGEVLHRNLIRENESVFWIPIDVVTNMTNMKEMFHRHQQRLDEVSKYAATMILSEDRMALRDALEKVVVDEVDRQEAAHQDVVPPTMTPSAAPVFAGDFEMPTKAANASIRPLDVHRMTVVFDKKTSIVRNLERYERGSEDGTEFQPLKLEVGRKERLSVRTDLVFHGLCILAPEALSLFKFFFKDVYELFSNILIDQELLGNSCAVEICTPNTVVCAINSISSYLFASWNVMNRLLFPLTRESNFANQRDHYALSHDCHTVYLNSEAKVGGGVAGRAGNVVIGPSTEIPATTRVHRSTFGRGVTLGENCLIEGCVLHDNVRVADNCILTNSVICSDVIVGETSQQAAGTSSKHCIEIHRSVVGRGVIVATTRKALYLEEVRLERCATSLSVPSLVGDKGQGRACAATQPSTILPVEQLFTSDNIPKGDDDGEASCSDDDAGDNAADNTPFGKQICKLVRPAIASPSRIEHIKIELKNIRLTYQKTNADLARVVVMILLKHVDEKFADHPRDAATGKAAFDSASALLSQWCRPFFVDFVTTQEEMNEVLVGVSVAIAAPNSVLLTQAPKLFECLYNSCDDDLYDEREFCVVSGDALLKFDDYVAELEEEEPTTLDDEERAVLKVGTLCAKYIAGVDALLNS